ncbi:MAG TPA: hypothetical protein VFD58_17165 [Blastocatellia bacterium]|nr:hypothetical protein [Blastocatellia bacterium]
MQYIPKGVPMHEKLSTSFVRIEALFDELQSQGFTGYVLLNFPQSTGYIYFNNGQVLNAIEESQRERHAGKKVSDHLLRQASQTRGTISIYNLQSEAVSTLAGLADGELVYQNLTSDFASLGKLIKKIAKERRLHYISLTFSDQPKEGGLVYIDGDRVEVFCSTPGGDLTGSQALQQLVSQSEGRLAAFSLYRARGSEAPAFDDKDVEASLNRLTQRPSPPPPPTPPPLRHGSSPQITTAPAAQAQPPVLSPAGDGGEVSAFARPRPDANGATTTQSRPAQQTKPGVAENEDILDVTEVEAENPAGSPTSGSQASGRPAPNLSTATTAPLTPVATQQVTLSEVKSGAEMGDLTGLMSSVIAAVERGMTVAGRGSSFPTALRAGLLAVTEQYPFLDPFAAEFEYHDREIVFVGSAQPEEFAKGLTEALRQMVEDLIYSSNGRVRDYIAEELVKVERERATDLSHFGLENITKRICQN